MVRPAVLAASLAVACGAKEPLRPTNPAALVRTLEELAAIGDKRVGTGGGRKAGDYVAARLHKAGLLDVHAESFAFPRHDVASASLALSMNGATASLPFEVFEGSGSGHVEAPIVYVASAQESDLAAVALVGKIALVDRDRAFHRSTQVKNVIEHGGLAMLYVSAAPDNLPQVGSVRRQFEASVAIPTLSLGAADGAMIKKALAAGQSPRATIDVAATSTRAMGQSLIGRIPGALPDEIVVGAHYDTWFAGSSDNGGGVAALLALAERRAVAGRPRYTLVFVAYDGEEVALYGGYDFLRRHRVLAADPILAVLNLEMPSALNSTLLGLAHSNHPALDESLKSANLGDLYPIYATMDVVPSLFGGIIPTDIQGIYRAGVPSASTAVDSPYYHTRSDTPDKVDAPMLATAVDDFDQALVLLCARDRAELAGHDYRLWSADSALRPRVAGAPLILETAIRDASGAPQPAAPVHVTLLVDDFFQTWTIDQTTGSDGRVTIELPASAVEQAAGGRFVHVTSGPTYPLVEQILAVE